MTAVYADNPLLVAAAAAALHDRTMVKRSKDELRTFVAATLGGGAQNIARVRLDVSVGSPADQILKAAARHRSDLIVMGAQGLTGARRVLIGSTTLGVLRRTRIPVLVVPGSGDSTPIVQPRVRRRRTS